MKIARTIAALREALRVERRDGRSIGFVPTMGALHDGHLSLLRRAREECDVVVLSIFVNPLQFGPCEDLGSYPRDEESDLAQAEAIRTDVVFLPSEEEMYGSSSSTRVVLGEVAVPLEGAARPGHFDGVATVVAKLFNAVQPDRSYFGQKDAQQVSVIKTMVRDLNFPVDVVVCPTIREADGLAMSSRNAYLGAHDRKSATVLWRALEEGRSAVASGAAVEVAEKAMGSVVAEEPAATLEYARVVDPDTFGPPVPGHPVLLVIAARVGPARLIDNVLVER